MSPEPANRGGWRAKATLDNNGLHEAGYGPDKFE
jgi:hypothetical protein